MIKNYRRIGATNSSGILSLGSGASQGVSGDFIRRFIVEEQSELTGLDATFMDFAGVYRNETIGGVGINLIPITFSDMPSNATWLVRPIIYDKKKDDVTGLWVITAGYAYNLDGSAVYLGGVYSSSNDRDYTLLYRDNALMNQYQIQMWDRVGCLEVGFGRAFYSLPNMIQAVAINLNTGVSSSIQFTVSGRIIALTKIGNRLYATQSNSGYTQTWFMDISGATLPTSWTSASSANVNNFKLGIVFPTSRPDYFVFVQRNENLSSIYVGVVQFDLSVGLPQAITRSSLYSFSWQMQLTLQILPNDDYVFSLGGSLNSGSTNVYRGNATTAMAHISIPLPTYTGLQYRRHSIGKDTNTITLLQAETGVNNHNFKMFQLNSSYQWVEVTGLDFIRMDTPMFIFSQEYGNYITNTFPNINNSDGIAKFGDSTTTYFDNRVWQLVKPDATIFENWNLVYQGGQP